MNFKEKLIAIEKSTEENSKAIKELKKELEKPGIDWCVGMWVENKKTGAKGYIAFVYDWGGCDIHYINKDGKWHVHTQKELNDDWKPTPYPYQEFLKVGDRVKREDEDDLVEGTIMEIDGAILILWDGCASRHASKSWYNPHQIAKIGEAK